jgi:hypothetical protein
MMRNTIFRHATAFAILASGVTAHAQSDPARGLWVGEVTLKYATEVTVPLDAFNNPIAPNPRIPTPTFDDANLRLILHVNGAGQVSLLRDVAIVRRKPDDLTSENDIALLTDERLYGEFPPQAAQRIASAVFDFGDARATAAVDAVVEKAITESYSIVGPLSQSDVNTSAKRATVEGNAFNAAKAPTTGAPSVIPTADAASRFGSFLLSDFSLAVVDALAGGGNDTAVRSAAGSLKSGSFYADDRGVAMLDAVKAAISGAAVGEEQAAARAAAAAYADTANDYQRFIGGEQFGDMISSGATAAGTAAGPLVELAIPGLTGTNNASPTTVTAIAHGLQNGAKVFVRGSVITALNGTHAVTAVTPDTFKIAATFTTPAVGAALGFFIPVDALVAAVNNDPVGAIAQTEALRVQIAAYNDTRAVDAVNAVRASMINAANAAASAAGGLTAELRERRVREAVFAAGHQSLSNNVTRYELPDGAPSVDYTDFVRSDTYANSAVDAARAVAQAMVDEKANNVLATEASIKGQGRAAAYRALEGVYSAAARSSQTTLSMQSGAVGGGFGSGNGDARLTADLGSGDTLAGPALAATLVLPASHPTNPFRHRQHPDHARGFDITRKIRIDFDDADPSPSPSAGFGVDRLTGVFREEIFGLHKSLGPDVDNPIGLRVEGRFELFRISLIDALDAR